MKIKRLTLAAFGLVAAAAFGLPAAAQTAKAALKDASGKDVGTVTLVQLAHGVMLRMSIRGLPAGEKAFHVHAVGKCDAPFTTAGGHFNPGARKHGLAAADGAHAGDMPNLQVPANGELSVEVLNTAITLAKGQPSSVFDADGSAIVIHAGPDDHKSDPAGNAGDRIACGVIIE